MLVKELIEKLHKFPQDAKIIMAKDAEGNQYSTLSGLYPIKIIDDRCAYDIEINGSDEEIEDDEINGILLCPV